MLAGFLLILVAFIPLLLWLLPRTIYLHIIPADQGLVVDGKECSAPCVLKLTPGQHQVEARRSGFEDLRHTIRVPILRRRSSYFNDERSRLPWSGWHGATKADNGNAE